MATVNDISKCVDALLKQYSVQSYLTYDDVLETAATFSLDSASAINDIAEAIMLRDILLL